MSAIQRHNRVLTTASIVSAVIVHVALQWGALFARSDFSFSSFRAYFAGDQLSYMSMVVNASQGELANVEPFTQTGTNSYPHLYYYFLGTVSRIVGISPLQAWAVGGLISQMILVAVLATALVLLSRRWWAALLAPIPFILGTFSVFLSDSWFTAMDSHAVLWGPFGVLFTLNGESVGLCMGAAALLLILIVFLRVRQPWARILLVCIASLTVGLLANVQTYAFLTVIYLLSYVVAAYVIVTARRPRLLAGISLVLVAGLFIVGPLIAAEAGPLVTLVLGLIPTVPGWIALIARSRGLVAVFILLAGLAALPQLLGTAQGILGDDPFLTYRVASSKNLGVDWRGIVGSLGISIPLLATLAAGLHRKNMLWIAYPVGALVAWILGATNDVWGANQEPYRFWLDLFVLISISALPIFVLAALSYFRPRPERATSESESESDLDLDLAPGVRSKTTLVATWVLALCVSTAAVSAVDFARFAVDTTYHSLWSYDNPRDNAIGQLGKEADAAQTRGLIVADPCVDVLAMKITSGAPVADYNVGMAWPADHDAVHAVMIERGENILSIEHAHAAGVEWAITDTACAVDWAATYADDLKAVSSVVYYENEVGEQERIQLWKIQ